jgi:hypothetical protein
MQAFYLEKNFNKFCRHLKLYLSLLVERCGIRVIYVNSRYKMSEKRKNFFEEQIEFRIIIERCNT